MAKKKRTKEEILKRLQSKKQQSRYAKRVKNRVLATRDISVQIDEEKRMIPFILISKDNAGERYDWWADETYIEELDIKGANYDELKTMFKDHRCSVDNAIAAVKNTRIENEELKADVFFGSDDDSLKIFQKYRDEILSDVSIGYWVNDLVHTSKKDEPDHVLITDYDIVELSAVWKGFDSGATMGREESEERSGDSDENYLIELKQRELKLKEKGLI